ncbi:MAG: sugar phosphate isomerase/epimerase [Streptomycetaceae bacterium]|nr:sugar phosphate isomerase/epimerase [Streptomycetaceae bacterium]
MNLGINLCFAVKRTPEPEKWARYVREDLGLDTVQFTFDLLDPWWPAAQRDALVARTVKAASDHGITIHSAYGGLAHYVPAGLLDPTPEGRRIALDFWKRACDVAAALGASAVGGPLGTMSIRDSSDEASREQRWYDLVDGIVEITAYAHSVGLAEFLVEPTPIARETPSTIQQCHELLQTTAPLAAVPVGMLLDTGHTLFEPLYGPGASVGQWIRELGPAIRAVHLDNSDGQGDPHWGWPDERGRIDVAEVGKELRTANLADVPLLLEVYPRFEDSDDHVRRLIAASVEHCRRALA